MKNGTDVLQFSAEANWLHITLNRPEAKNALKTAVLSEIASALEAAAKDASCRVVLLSGAGGNFAAGADIGEIASKTSAEAAVDPRKDFWARIRAFPKPLVAAVDGFCLGGGFELAMMADCIVIGETARLGLPETNLGLIPGAGGGQRLTALIGRARASRMILTGEIINAETAFEWGISAWKVAGSAVPEAEALCTKLAARAPLALEAAKRAIVCADENTLSFALERKAFEMLLDSHDKNEGIAAFRNKRKAEFKGQ